MDYESLSLLQAVRRWPRVTLYTLAMALNILLWGYDSAIVGNVASMPAFQEVFGVRAEKQYIIPSIWLSMWGVALSVGSMIGAMIGGYVQDLTGRRWTLCIGGVLSIVAIATCYVSDTAADKNGVLLGGKLLEGTAIGIIICSTQTYLSEVIPARLRGPLLALFPISVLLGQLVAAIVVLVQLNTPGKASYRNALASEWPLSAVPLALAFVLPESPVWLLQKNKTQAARDAFRRLHGAKVAQEHSDLFEDMHKAVNEERWAAQDRQASYLECFRGTNLRRSLIVIFSVGMEELFGLTLLGNVSYFLQLIGISHSQSFIMLIMGVLLGLSANIGSFWTLLKFGRRPLTYITLAIASIIWGSIGIAGCFKGIGVAWYCAAGMMAIVVTTGLGAWPASYVIAAETSSLRLRSKTQGVGWLLGGVIRTAFGMGVPYLYNADAGNLGGKTGFVYFATSMLGAVITWFFVPELKGLSAVEIDRVFETKAPVRRANTAQWEALSHVETEDEVPLRERSGTRGSDAADASSIGSGERSVEPARPVEPYEPLRKRPTF